MAGFIRPKFQHLQAIAFEDGERWGHEVIFSGILDPVHSVLWTKEDDKIAAKISSGFHYFDVDFLMANAMARPK
jgi:hypothetical protein